MGRSGFSRDLCVIEDGGSGCRSGFSRDSALSKMRCSGLKPLLQKDQFCRSSFSRDLALTSASATTLCVIEDAKFGAKAPPIKRSILQERLSLQPLRPADESVLRSSPEGRWVSGMEFTPPPDGPAHGPSSPARPHSPRCAGAPPGSAPRTSPPRPALPGTSGAGAGWRDRSPGRRSGRGSG